MRIHTDYQFYPISLVMASTSRRFCAEILQSKYPSKTHWILFIFSAIFFSFH